MKRGGSLTSKSDYLWVFSACCLPCLAAWLLFTPAAKCCLHMFIHVATGCFIHQDGTYHSRIGGGKKKRPVFTGSSITNKWTKKSLIGIPKKFNCNVSETAENTRASNLFKGDKWFWSTLLLRNNRGGCTVKALSFGRPLIGSVEQQNCVYSSQWKCNQINLYRRVLAFTPCPVIAICPKGYGNGYLHGAKSPISHHVSVMLPY